MATVTKDFRIKSGLVVEGTNATVDGSDIITEDALTGGTQTNISVTYDAQTKTVSFVAENGVDDSTTDDLDEGTTNKYFTDVRAKESAADLLTNATKTNITITGDENGLTITAENGVADSDTDDLTEGTTNLYYTDTRARAAVSAGDGLDYNSSTGVFSADLGTGLEIDGTGQIQVDRTTVDTWYDPAGAAATAEQNANDYTDNAVGAIPSAVLSIAGDTGTDSVTLASDTLTISGGEGIDVNVTNNTITIDAEDATTTNKGVASFNDDNFTVTDGAVSSKSITLGNATLELGGTTMALTGLTTLSADNISISGNEISSLNENGNISINPNGDGVVDVNSSRITNLAAPDQSTDAATKAYVDAATTGLNVHNSVQAATTASITIGSITDGSIIDGVTLASGNRVLVKNQGTLSQNGIYFLNSGVLQRAADYNEVGEVDAGDFVFVEAGNTNGKTGWVQTNTITTIGTDAIEFTQFSGAGTYLAGTNLNLDGNTFSLEDEITLTTVNADLVGNVTGNVDGDLTGNVTGQVSDISNHDTGDLAEGTNLYFTDQRAYDAVDGSSTINFVEVEINSIAKQVAATYTTSSGDNVVYAFPDTYRSGKFLVKLARGTHTEVSEILVTLDTADNIAITEYAIVGTNGSLGTISATYDGINEDVQITVNTPSATGVKVVGTIIE